MGGSIMGTRSLTRVIDKDNQEYVTIYRQFDGYPEGHGLQLAKFLEGRKIVNGIPVKATDIMSNGPGDLAAQLVAFLKDEFPVGGVYIYPAGSNDCWQEFEYLLYIEEGKEPIIEVLDNDKSCFKGNVEEFYKWQEGYK
jgi:hypothetical protein